jgi:hypothetical protein
MAPGLKVRQLYHRWASGIIFAQSNQKVIRINNPDRRNAPRFQAFYMSDLTINKKVVLASSSLLSGLQLLETFDMRLFASDILRPANLTTIR